MIGRLVQNDSIWHRLLFSALLFRDSSTLKDFSYWLVFAYFRIVKVISCSRIRLNWCSVFTWASLWSVNIFNHALSWCYWLKIRNITLTWFYYLIPRCIESMFIFCHLKIIIGNFSFLSWFWFVPKAYVMIFLHLRHYWIHKGNNWVIHFWFSFNMMNTSTEERCLNSILTCKKLSELSVWNFWLIQTIQVLLSPRCLHLSRIYSWKSIINAN